MVVLYDTWAAQDFSVEGQVDLVQHRWVHAVCYDP
jgi:hypothetical protein